MEEIIWAFVQNAMVTWLQRFLFQTDFLRFLYCLRTNMKRRKNVMMLFRLPGSAGFHR